MPLAALETASIAMSLRVYRVAVGLVLESGIPGVEPEGNAHQAEFTLNSDRIIAADEDFVRPRRAQRHRR